ncbi:MAG: hypothetical protein K0S18_1769 [Anaerocolumna sp.]|nr:hypothetical protein [Anaerocolumna sp.]
MARISGVDLPREKRVEIGLKTNARTRKGPKRTVANKKK